MYEAYSVLYDLIVLWGDRIDMHLTVNYHSALITEELEKKYLKVHIRI